MGAEGRPHALADNLWFVIHACRTAVGLVHNYIHVCGPWVRVLCWRLGGYFDFQRPRDRAWPTICKAGERSKGQKAPRGLKKPGLEGSHEFPRFPWVRLDCENLTARQRAGDSNLGVYLSAPLSKNASTICA
jgi:hypothetical protein